MCFIFPCQYKTGGNTVMRMYSFVDTEMGRIYSVLENNLISAIYIGDYDFEEREPLEQVYYSPNEPLLKECTTQLQEYFSGNRKEFSIPIQPQGTAFQMAIWNQLLTIPFGETRSYLDIAVEIGNPQAVRAVGQANKANSLPIIIPCHRVIGKNASLTGYAGTRTDIKEILLDLEGAAYKK
jgi:methylated-DNA-[protein]-cysteine S-methyltransferase